MEHGEILCFSLQLCSCEDFKRMLKKLTVQGLLTFYKRECPISKGSFNDIQESSTMWKLLIRKSPSVILVALWIYSSVTGLVPACHTPFMLWNLAIICTPDDKIQPMKSFQNLSKLNMFKLYWINIHGWISKSLFWRTVKTPCCLNPRISTHMFFRFCPSCSFSVLLQEEMRGLSCCPGATHNICKVSKLS